MTPVEKSFVYSVDVLISEKNNCLKLIDILKMFCRKKLDFFSLNILVVSSIYSVFEKSFFKEVL